MSFGAHKSAAPWWRYLSMGFALIGASFRFGLLTSPALAAENIAAHLDSTGRLVFVNEDIPPAAPAPGKKALAIPASRRVISSTKPSDAIAPAVAPAATPEPSMGPASEQDNSLPAAASHPASLDELIEQTAARHQVDPELVRAIVRVESNYNPYAVSPAGAQGLMQLIPATAMRFGVANPFDPQANLDGGVRYLKYLLGQYGGNLQLSLAAYNAGEDAVARSGNTIPSIRETQNYIRKIAQLYPQQAMPVLAGEPSAPSIMKFVDSTGVVHFSNTDF